MLRNAEYIRKYVIDDKELAENAQVGVDLTVNKLYEITEDFILSKDGFGKKMAKNVEIQPDPMGFFHVKKGKVYSIEMDQGLKNLSEGLTAFIYQRSTLARNGIFIRSSVYDPGFGTPAMGAILYAFNSGQIEQHMRVAQILFHQNEPANLYSGQYQNKNSNKG